MKVIKRVNLATPEVIGVALAGSGAPFLEGREGTTKWRIEDCTSKLYPKWRVANYEYMVQTAVAGSRLQCPVLRQITRKGLYHAGNYIGLLSQLHVSQDIL
jgi:hypothetical protein